MTSNAGSDWKGSGIGFAESASSQRSEKVMRALKAIFRPEFLNRVDEIVVFGELSRSEMLGILDIMLGELNEMLAEKGMSLVAGDEVREKLVDEAAAKHMGARPLRRLIERKIEDKLSDIIIRGGRPKKITAAVSDGEIVCE